MATPQIPPRPMKMAQHPAVALGDAPKIPPRPIHRSLEPAVSRDNFPRSPLNEVPFAMNLGSTADKSQDQDDSEASSGISLPPRPPSVSLPSVGQEGMEYAGIEYEKPQAVSADSTPAQMEPEQTRNVGSDLPLYAPTPSFSTSTAKARVAAVTRTDSVQAAAAGIGKIGTPLDDKNPYSRALRPKVSLSSLESSPSTERPESALANDSDHGIPEIGQRVPMYPDAGDVQAPSPAPFVTNMPSGTGPPHDGNPKPGRHHSRTRSGREGFRGPPGSYGMHGHGVSHHDQFEKAWYDKHPDALAREENGQYGPGIGGGRGEWALSSEDLNKIVRDTARRGSGFGTAASIDGLPNEQIGYRASEEYASRISSPSTAIYQNKAHSNHSQTHIESPLRKASFPVDVDGKATFDRSKETHDAAHPRPESALESETEDDEVHVDAPAFRISKYTGNGYDRPTEDLGPLGGNSEAEGGWIQETGYGVPILASDEVAKEPGSEYLQPAVSPMQERRGSTHYAGIDSDAPPSYQSGYRNHSRPGSASNSRPSSRPVSIHGLLPGLSRFASLDEREDMHTPLEDVDEYEPLFPENEGREPRSVPASERFTRREHSKRRFPSQDIWEDTPNSLQLQATVETPEPVADLKRSAVVEPPEVETKRNEEIDEAEKAILISKEDRPAKSNWKPYLQDEMVRSGMKQRFPSQDIWEESPDSARLETTVEASPSEELKSPLDGEVKASEAVADAGGRRGTRIDSENTQDESLSEVSEPSTSAQQPGPSARSEKPTDAGGQAVPSVPTRPARRVHEITPANVLSHSPTRFQETSENDSKQVAPSETRKTPVSLPDRPKPQIPARPARFAARDVSETVPRSTTLSSSSTGSGEGRDQFQSLTSPPPALPKAKPVIPSRPVGGKIASLKAGFLSDLDKRLQLGPLAPKVAAPKVQAEEAEVEEKTPLADARKGRAKGPARRKPVAAAPSTPSTVEAAVVAEDAVKPRRWNWGIQEVWTVWETEENGSINVVHGAESSSVLSKEKEIDDVEGLSGVLASVDSVSASARDTPTTSSRDEIIPTPDDPAEFSTDVLEEKFSNDLQPVAGSTFSGEGGRNEAETGVGPSESDRDAGVGQLEEGHAHGVSL